MREKTRRAVLNVNEKRLERDDTFSSTFGALSEASFERTLDDSLKAETQENLQQLSQAFMVASSR